MEILNKRPYPFERVLLSAAALMLALCVMFELFSSLKEPDFVEKTVAISTQTENRISLNTASEEELRTLDSIGKVKAANIVEYRTENGGFNTIEEVKEVDLIGEKTFEKIKDYICV